MAQAYRRLASASPEQLAWSRAAERLLDSHHVVARAVRIRSDLEDGFQRRLPRDCGPEATRLARVALLAHELLVGAELDIGEATPSLRRFGEQAALTIVESPLTRQPVSSGTTTGACRTYSIRAW